MIGMHGGEVHGWTGTHGWSLTAPRAPGGAAASPHHLQAEGDDTSWQRPGDAATAACVPVCDGSDDADRAAARAVPRETERPQDVANSSHRPQNGHDEPSWQHSTWATGGAAECLALFNVHTPVGIPHSQTRRASFGRAPACVRCAHARAHPPPLALLYFYFTVKIPAPFCFTVNLL